MAQNGCKRPVRIANCSGATGDPGLHMYNQAKYGPIDVITGDYLAEVNLATYAEPYAQGQHPGWVSTAMDGITLTLDLLNEKRIKLVINGGALNPRGMAEKVHAMVQEKGLDLAVAYVDGDNLMHKVDRIIAEIKSGSLAHLDDDNSNVRLAGDTRTFLDDPERMPIVSANAYLGYRAIYRGLAEGADIVICGRVADASPVMGAAAWWHSWKEDDYDALAGSLVAGHLIECSTYATGANFAGFHQYDTESLLDLGLPIAEIDDRGHTVLTKHEALNGIVTVDTTKCQLLYELQGNTYLNSDVKADLVDISITQESKNRVLVTGVVGFPPPPTTKLAVFYKAGYQCELLLNACGYATSKKWDVQEAQMRKKLKDWNVRLDVLDFQRVGTAMQNPDSQLASTTYLRIFAQDRDAATLGKVMQAWMDNSMAHFAGMHCSLDFRTVVPKLFLGYYPATILQSEIEEAVNIFARESVTDKAQRFVMGPPKMIAPIGPRESYGPRDVSSVAESFGPTVRRPLGDLVLARSGDKGGNVNLGLFVHTPEQWRWFCPFMTCDKLRELMGKDWQDWYHIERVELPNLYAVHFVVYGHLGRGVSSSKLLDSLGKGFGEFIRAVHVDIPAKFLDK